MYQVWLKSLDIYSCYRPETNIWVCLGQITVKIWHNLPISNLKPDLHNINAHTKFGENPLMFTGYHLETKIWACLRQITPSKFNKNCPLAIPNQISTISAHNKFGENPLMFTHVIIRKQNTDRQMDDWRTDGQTHGCTTWNHNILPLKCGGV